MSKRRSDQIQPGKGKPAETQVTRTPEGGTPEPQSNEPAAEGTAADPNALGKYWIAIILWVASFTLMIVFELMSALFRR